MSIMNEEPMCVIARYRFSELLHRPIGCGLGGHIAMQHAAGADLHYHEYIKDTEASGDRDHEVTCQQDSGMIAHKPFRFCEGRRGWRDLSSLGQYARTVRGETLMPSFNQSSSAMRSSPQVGLS